MKVETVQPVKLSVQLSEIYMCTVYFSRKNLSGDKGLVFIFKNICQVNFKFCFQKIELYFYKQLRVLFSGTRKNPFGLTPVTIFNPLIESLMSLGNLQKFLFLEILKNCN